MSELQESQHIRTKLLAKIYSDLQNNEMQKLLALLLG
jgi:hypothetical protein